MTELDQDLSVEKIRDLVADIIECVESETGTPAKVTRIADCVAIMEIDGFKFRLEIHDMNRFQ